MDEPRIPDRTGSARAGEDGSARHPGERRATRSRSPGTPRRDARAAASRHSRLVRSLKIVLPIVALLAGGVVAARALLFSYVPDIDLPSVLFSKDGLTMVEPRLSGRTRDRAYEVVAARAIQNLQDPKKLALERIDARIELTGKQWAKVESAAGLYDTNVERLRLDGGISVATSHGYTAATQSADFDLKTGRMASDGAIRIEGPVGSVEAGRLEVEDNGTLLRFVGSVRMTIRQGAIETRAPAAGGIPAEAPADRVAGAGAGEPRTTPQ